MRLSARTPQGAEPSPGWATGLGIVRQYNLTTNSVSTTLCFTRPADSTAALSPSINPRGAGLGLN